MAAILFGLAMLSVTWDASGNSRIRGGSGEGVSLFGVALLLAAASLVLFGVSALQEGKSTLGGIILMIFAVVPFLIAAPMLGRWRNARRPR